MDQGIEKQKITHPAKERYAKGAPGARPRWSSGAKTIVGTAATSDSRVWFTLNNGVLAEIYFPDVDQADTRMVRFLITGPDGFFSDELWDADHKVMWLEPGVPGARVETRCKRGRYTMEKEIVTDPVRDILLLRVRFTPAKGNELRLFLVADPHIGDEGANNRAWAGAYKGVPMLFACRGQLALAIGADPPLMNPSVGYVGVTDAYTLLSQGKPLTGANIAKPGNVAVAAEIDLHSLSKRASNDGTFVISLACGGDPAEAGQQARAGLLQDFAKTRALFVRSWQTQQAESMAVEDLSGGPLDMYRVSTAVLETHQSKRFPGGFVASLSLPWGFARTDKDVGGYHVVWPRDLVEIAMGKLASGDARSARSTLFYLACTQGDDGGWSQNMWLDGTPHWGALQMDGIALPILLADKLRRDDALDGYDPRHMMKQATCFLLKHGPVTQQGRWEALPGFSPYTMAVQVGALLAGAECADERDAPEEAQFSARDSRCLERCSGRVDLCARHGACACSRHRGLLRPDDAAAAHRDPHHRRPQNLYAEPAPAAVGAARGRHRQPGCAGAGALRAARGGRSAHGQHGEGGRCHAAARDADRIRMDAVVQGRLWRKG